MKSGLFFFYSYFVHIFCGFIINAVQYSKTVNCKKETQTTVSTLLFTSISKASLQFDWKIANFVGCQRVVHKPFRSWTFICLKNCAFDSLKKFWLRFNLTQKLHILLALKGLYISLSKTEHQPAKKVVHRTPWKNLYILFVDYSWDIIFVASAIFKTFEYLAQVQISL